MFSVFRAGCETELKLSPKLQLLLQETGYFQLPDLENKEVRMSCLFFFFFLSCISDKASDEKEWKLLFLKLPCHKNISLEWRLKPYFGESICSVFTVVIEKALRNQHGKGIFLAAQEIKDLKKQNQGIFLLLLLENLWLKSVSFSIEQQWAEADYTQGRSLNQDWEWLPMCVDI